jgi:isochorismate pyruvate lyase
MKSHRPPEACESLCDLRAEIDRLDRDIVRLLVERGGYVLAAARFKRSTAEVRAPDRVEAVVANARRLAQAQGGAGELVDVVERVYRELIAAGTEAEQRHWLRDHAVAVPPTTDAGVVEPSRDGASGARAPR